MRTRVLHKWSKDWALLKAWNRDLSEVEVEISDQKFPKRAGTCWSFEQRLVIYVSGSLAEDLAVLLHEFAHAATIGEGHGEEWQRIYSEAVQEVTGIRVPLANNYHTVHHAALQAIKSWWKTSGNAFAVSLLIGKKQP